MIQSTANEQHIEQPVLGNQRVTGQLSLRFAHDPTLRQTRLIACEQQPPLRVIRAFSLDDGAALVHLHNLSGGVLGGDRLALAVEVGPQAAVQLTTTGATRLYRCRPDAPPAVQTASIQVDENALLEYLPDPLIPFAGSRYQQHTRITLSAGAGLFWWEMVAPGRTARGELFDYDLLRNVMQISAEGKPLAIERFELRPHHRPLSSPARLGPYRYLCSFYICRVGLEPSRWSRLEQTLGEIAREISRPGEISWGVSSLVAHGLVFRALSQHGRDLSTGLLAFWRAAKLALYGREAIPPRKIY